MKEKENIDLLLINPSDRNLYRSVNDTSAIGPPLWTALIGGFIRDKGFSVKIIDANAENIFPDEIAKKILDLKPLLVGIIVMGSNPSASSTPKMTVVGEMLREFGLKKKETIDKGNEVKTKIILAGLHPSALPRETLIEKKPDFVCEGEGFYTILELLNLLKKTNQYNLANQYYNHEPIIEELGQIRGLWYFDKNHNTKNGRNPELIKNLDDLPIPAWDLLNMSLYRAHNWHCFGRDNGNYGVIYTSLGCPFNCGFCNIHAIYNNNIGIRYRNPEKVLEDIDTLVKKHGVKNIKIWDELFSLKEDRVIKICDLIVDKNYNPQLNFWAYARVDKLNAYVLKKMKQAGINWIAIGFESASSEVRKGVSKKFGQDKIKEVINMTKLAGINVIGNFIFGLPDDNMETMQETLNLAKELNCEYANFYCSMPYPGSKLYDDAIKNNVRLPERWEDYSQYGGHILPLDTKYIIGKEVLKFRDEAFIDYFTNPIYLNMIREKFGDNVVKQITDMVKVKIRN